MSKIPQVKTYEGLPVVTAEKMKYLDKKAVMEYKVREIDLMENAGRGVAAQALKLLGENEKNILACCGRGNNGGDGLVAARFLKESGKEVEVLIMPPRREGYGKLVVENINRAKTAGIKIGIMEAADLESFAGKFGRADAFVDALLGVGATGKPAGVLKKAVQMMNKAGKKIFSVDLPSGLNPDTGHHSGVFVKAYATFTLGFPKAGLMAPHAQKNIGILKIVDIGYPAQIIAEAEK